MSRIGFTLFAAIVVFANPAQGQPGRGGGSGLPEPGEQLPVVTVFDEHGKEFSTKNLRGDYTVLVFGCLT